MVENTRVALEKMSITPVTTNTTYPTYPKRQPQSFPYSYKKCISYNCNNRRGFNALCCDQHVCTKEGCIYLIRDNFHLCDEHRCSVYVKQNRNGTWQQCTNDAAHFYTRECVLHMKK
jgi:hypothetical protein